jgi:hypothetical protein
MHFLRMAASTVIRFHSILRSTLSCWFTRDAILGGTPRLSRRRAARHSLPSQSRAPSFNAASQHLRYADELTLNVKPCAQVGNRALFIDLNRLPAESFELEEIFFVEGLPLVEQQADGYPLA